MSLKWKIWANNTGPKTHMTTSSNENISVLLTLCAGNSPVNGEFPSQRPVTRSFDVFFDLRLNKRLSEQSWGWWFETPSRSLWRHCNGHMQLWTNSYTACDLLYHQAYILTEWNYGNTVWINLSGVSDEMITTLSNNYRLTIQWTYSLAIGNFPNSRHFFYWKRLAKPPPSLRHDE